MDKDLLTAILTVLAVSTLVDTLKLYLKLRNSRTLKEAEHLREQGQKQTKVPQAEAKEISELQKQLEERKESLKAFKALIKEWGLHLSPVELEGKQVISSEDLKKARVKLELARLVVESMRESGYKSTTSPSLEDAIQDMTRVQSNLEYLVFHKRERKLKAQEKAQAARTKHRQHRPPKC